MTHTLTMAQQKELKDAFDLFDTDRSGRISSQELKQVFKALNLKVSEDQLGHFVSQMDKDGSGQIEFSEFVQVMADTLLKKYSKAELRTAFEQFDQDHSGYIQARELTNIFNQMGRHYSEEQMKTIISSFDLSGDGKISFDEFVKLFD